MRYTTLGEEPHGPHNLGPAVTYALSNLSVARHDGNLLWFRRGADPLYDPVVCGRGEFDMN